MDESNDSQNVSRIPTLEDLVKLCGQLNAQRVQYVVIGGFAVIQQGYLRATTDIDLLIHEDLQNLEKAKTVLSALPDHAAKELDTQDLAKYSVIRIADEIVVDLLVKACGKKYEDLKPFIEQVEVGGIKIPFLTAEGLIQTKQGIRPKDMQDRLFLENKLKPIKKL